MSSAKNTRRKFLRQSLALGTLAAAPWVANAQAKARVVIIGGGFGGATCARYLRQLDSAIDVTLVEPKKEFLTCPFSNLVVAGIADMARITHDYKGLASAGVNVVHERAATVDSAKRRVTLASGGALEYDSLVVSPGIEMRYDAVPGYDHAAASVMPHAWQVGAQTKLLRDQLTAMDDGGLVIIAPPGNPFRCPPGPYERASLMAHYLKQHKPRSKILILDAKDKFSKQGLFTQGWDQEYPGMIEWVAGSAGGLVESVDAGARKLMTESGFTEHSAAVINFIPPQRAGKIAELAGLTDSSGWCPVNQHTFESTQASDVYVIGDAAIAGKMPKSGFSANSQGKVCAAAIVSAFNGLSAPSPSYANTCYSLVGPDYGISVSAVYRLTDGAIVPVSGAGGVSPIEVGPEFRANEARYASSWYDAISADIWG